MVDLSNQVIWTKKRLDTFVENASLSEFEERVIRTRAKGWSIVQQSIELNVSVSTINKTIKKLKEKYDIVADGEKLPYRKVH